MIVVLLDKNNYQEAIGYIHKLLELNSFPKDMGILYLAIYICKTAKEFN
jgi:hypothetical protein